MIKQYLIFTGALLMLLFGTTLRAQQLSYELQWSDIQEVKITDEYSLYQLYFEGASYRQETGEIPVFENRIRAGATDVIPIVTLNDLVFEDIRGDLTKVKAYEKISQQIEPRASLQLDRKQPYTVFSFVPVRYNNFTGTYEKLISFSVSIEYEPVPERQSASVKNYATTSVLSSGKWYKIAVQNTGIHRISYGKLQEMGLDPGSINPRNLRVYGNGGGMLSESLNDFAYDDLQENAIQVVGENDGSFDQDDYILFYAESPHSWKPDNTGKIFHHSYNLYSEYTYYFITR